MPTTDSAKPSAVDFLKRLRDRLKDHLDPDDFNAAVRLARSHAGGVAKARNRADAAKAGDEDESGEGKVKSEDNASKSGEGKGSDGKAGTGKSVEGEGKPADPGRGISISLKAASDDPLDGIDETFQGAMYGLQLEKADPRVNYQMASTAANVDDDGDLDTCGGCRFYSRGRCQLVEGVIEVSCVCDLFTEPPDIGTSSVVSPMDYHEGPGKCPDCGQTHAKGETPHKKKMIPTSMPADQYFADHERPTFDPDLKLSFQLQQFAEAPEWIPFLPKPGNYTHPRWGQIKMTSERSQRMMRNFADKVYQGHIPIDLEHSLKASGAAGYIADLRSNSDGSVDAKIDWTDLGTDAIAKNRFRYFSPEWWDKWNHPMTGVAYSDVIVGGALTTKPFFKEGALRPLIASEGQLYVFSGDEFDEDWEEALETFSDEPMAFYGRGKNPMSHGHGGSGASNDGPSSKAPIGVSHESSAAASAAAQHLQKGDRVTHRTGQSGTIVSVSRPLKNTRHETDPGKYHNMLNVRHDDGSVSTWRDSHLTSHTPTSSRRPKPTKASEGDDEMGMTEEEARRFSETITRLDDLSTRYEASETARTAAEESLKKANETVESMVAADRTRRFTELTKDWVGETARNITTLESLAKSFGEDSDEFTGFVTSMKSAAETVKTSSLMTEVGHPRARSFSANQSVTDQIDEMAHKYMSEDPKLTIEQARVKAFDEKPELYDAFETARLQSIPVNGQTR